MVILNILTFCGHTRDGLIRKIHQSLKKHDRYQVVKGISPYGKWHGHPYECK